MKSLFQTFQKSLYNPSFYREVAETPTGDALRYYVRAVCAIAVAATVLFSFILVPQGVRFMREVAPTLVHDYYPAELAVTIKNGAASTNVTEPYTIAAKGVTLDALQTQGLKNLLVIDTTRDFSPRVFDESKTFAFLTKNELVTYRDAEHMTIQKLRLVPDMMVDQATVATWVEKVRGKLPYIVPVGIFMTFLALFFGYVMYLLLLFLFALIPFFLAWVRKVPLSYGGAYKMSVYAVVPGLVLKTLLNLSGFFFVPAYLSLLVFTLIIFLNVREVEQPTLFEGNN